MRKKRRELQKFEFDIERTQLAEERTLYSKERTVLNTIGLFIAVIGLGIAINRFFEEMYRTLGTMLTMLGTLGALYYAYIYYKLDAFVKKVEIKNKAYFSRLKREIEKL